jgi:hypothetical protein
MLSLESFGHNLERSSILVLFLFYRFIEVFIRFDEKFYTRVGHEDTPHLSTDEAKINFI